MPRRTLPSAISPRSLALVVARRGGSFRRGRHRGRRGTGTDDCGRADHARALGSRSRRRHPRPRRPAPWPRPGRRSRHLTKPLWAELTAEQQQALQPLAPHWNTLNVGQKRKWLALSRNYASLPAEDQITLRSRDDRMGPLSNQQRVQARLNFAEVKRVPADERKRPSGSNTGR